MSFHRIHESSSKNTQTSQDTSQFAPRPFPVEQTQQESGMPPTQEEIENEAFEQDQFEARKLQLKEKYGTIAPAEQERLGVLQAKMDSFWVQRRERTKGQPNLLEILTRKGRATPATAPAQPIQPKLAIGQPNDQYEQEADRVAEQVISMTPPAASNVQRQTEEEEQTEIQRKPLAETITPMVQRLEASEEEEPVQTKCEGCEAEEQIQRSPDSVAQSQPNLESRLNSSKDGGSPLSDEVRSFMEPRFGFNFSQVRVHTDSEAVQMNRELNAQAFTHGSHIYFGEGKSPANDNLTAHEMTHVLQQTGGEQIQRFGNGLWDTLLGVRDKVLGTEEGESSDAQRPLAEKIVTDLQQGGITIAAYAASNVNQAGEFKRQATRFALDHGALGLRRDEVSEGIAMELTENLPSLLESLTAKIGELLARFPDLVNYQSIPINVRTLAIFTHGGRSQLQAGPNGQWIQKSLEPWVEALTPYLSPSPNILLYACSTAGNPSSGIPFAQALQQILQESLEKRYGTDVEVAPEVWGHEDKGHTTANNRLVRFGGEPGSSGEENFLDLLGQRLVAHAMVETGYIVSTNEEWEQLAQSGRRTMMRVMLASTGSKDPTNAYIREVPQMGIDRVWSDLTAASMPDLSDLRLAPDAIERVTEGLKRFRERFTKEIAEFKQRLRSYSNTK